MNNIKKKFIIFLVGGILITLTTIPIIQGHYEKSMNNGEIFFEKERIGEKYFLYNNEILDLAVTNLADGSVSVFFGDGQGNFGFRKDYSIGETPCGVFYGDFNCDNISDLAVPNSNKNYCNILLGTEYGEFNYYHSFKTGNYPYSITGGYFNQDKYLDLAVPNRLDNTVGIYFGNGDGTFIENQLLSVGRDPDGILAEECNRDEYADLIITNQDDRSISIFLGDDEGHFSLYNTMKTGLDPCFIISDFVDSDDHKDLIVTAQSFGHDNGSICVFLGKGNGDFNNRIEYIVGGNPSSIALGDYNCDDFLDLAVSNHDDNFISLLYGDGAGKFENRKDIIVGERPYGIVTNDFNRDGFLDLAVANYDDDNINILFGNGMGDFDKRQLYDVGLNPCHIIVANLHRNKPPEKPQITGITNGSAGVDYTYTINCNDSDSFWLWYQIDWGDNNITDWIGQHSIDVCCKLNYSWKDKGTYSIKVKAKDEHGLESDWSDPLEVAMPHMHNFNPIVWLIEQLIQRYPFLEYIIK